MLLTTMMRTPRYSAAAALIVSLLLSHSSGFAPNVRHVSRKSTFGAAPSVARHSVARHVSKAEELEAESIINMNFLTPEGTGLSSPISRIVRLSKRGKGFYRAGGADRVVDIMEGITAGVEDVALAYDEETKKLLGIFTESDYIKVRSLLCCYLVYTSLSVTLS